MQIRGKIELIIGPMFAGKTTEMLRKVRRFHYAKKKCLIIRYSGGNLQNNLNTIDTQLLHQAKSIQNLQSIKHIISQYDVIAIDQAHFFQDLIEFVQEIANQNIIVIIAALNGTFQRKPYLNITNLLPIAQNICSLTAICYLCSQQASFTHLAVAQVQGIKYIDKANYRPVCRSCYFKLNSTKAQIVDK